KTHRRQRQMCIRDRAIVSLLNQLPAWTQAACDEPASRLRLQQEMVLGALAGALGMAVHTF
ncbi:hypothetical protein ACM9NO_27515, partial [Pseudomonas paraeruginosa]